MTSESEDHRHGHPRCGARKKQGEGVCTQAAGWGTPHPGVGHCKLHGGSTPAQTTGAVRRRAESEARAVLADLGVPSVEDPLAALLKLAGQVLAWQEATATLVNGYYDTLNAVRKIAIGGSGAVLTTGPRFVRAS